jgi:hypothetical protein
MYINSEYNKFKNKIPYNRFCRIYRLNRFHNINFGLLRLPLSGRKIKQHNIKINTMNSSIVFNGAGLFRVVIVSAV